MSFIDPAKKIPKEIIKKLKKFKNHFPTLFLAKTGWDRRGKRKKKNLLPNSVQTRLGQENSEKIAKKLKTLKNLFPTLFLAKTGWDRPRKRKKKIYFRIPFVLDSGKKIPKKIAKKLEKLKKPLSDINFSQNGLR